MPLFVMPTKAGIAFGNRGASFTTIPAFAGMTGEEEAMTGEEERGRDEPPPAPPV